MKVQIQIFLFCIVCAGLVFAQIDPNITRTLPSPTPDGKVNSPKTNSSKPGIETVTGTQPANSKANSTQLTLDELTKKLYRLEQQVNSLESKIKFSDFSVIEYEIKPEDLTPTRDPTIRFKNDVRINDPGLNNQPHLKLFVRSDEELALTTFFRSA